MAAKAAEAAKRKEAAMQKKATASTAAAREAKEERATLTAVRIVGAEVRAVQMVCGFCGKLGHLTRWCPVLDAEVDEDLRDLMR